eukprot:IDg22404t1
MKVFVGKARTTEHEHLVQAWVPISDKSITRIDQTSERFRSALVKTSVVNNSLYKSLDANCSKCTNYALQKVYSTSTQHISLLHKL